MSLRLHDGQVVILNAKALFRELLDRRAIVRYKNKYVGIHIVDRYVTNEEALRCFLFEEYNVVDDYHEVNISPIVSMLKKRKVLFPAEYRYSPNRLEELKKYMACPDSWITVPKRSQCLRYYDSLPYRNKKPLRILSLNAYGMDIIQDYLYGYKPFDRSLLGDGVGFVERDKIFKETTYYILD